MIALAIWLLEFGYGMLYVAYCNLSNHQGISFVDAFNPRLNGGPCKDGSCTKCSANQTQSATTPNEPVSPPVGTSLA